jgi:hypothetical protein
MQIAAAATDRHNPTIAIVRPTPPRFLAALMPMIPNTMPGMKSRASKNGNQLRTSAMMPSTNAVVARPLVAFAN